MKKKTMSFCLAGLLWTATWTATARGGDVEKQIETPVRKAVRIEQQTQAERDTWRDEKETMQKTFEALEAEVAALEAAIDREARRRAALTDRVAQIKAQLEDIAQVSHQLYPYLDQLLERIRTFVDRDLPFLPEERSKRLQALETLNRDPEVPVSEKYRKIMEALMVEAEYGQTVEVCQRTIDLSGEKTLVNIFRLGRLRLFYQTLDRQHAGFYNTATRTWEPLDRTYLKTIQNAVAMGYKRKPVEILDLPLGRIAAP